MPHSSRDVRRQQPATCVGVSQDSAIGPASDAMRRRSQGPQRDSLRSLCGPACREQPGTDENGRLRTPVFSRLSRKFVTRFKVLILRLFIGETGFEPATARPPAGCATRLRHSPWHSMHDDTTRLKQAGDGNRTRPRSLEGFCATTTLRPPATGILPAFRSAGPLVRIDSADHLRPESQAIAPASIAHCLDGAGASDPRPALSNRPPLLRRYLSPLPGHARGRPGPEPVVARAIERDRRPVEGATQR